MTGPEECPEAASHGDTHRLCDSCTWIEEATAAPVVVGETVHYVSSGGDDRPVCLAAIVTQAAGWDVGLCILAPTGITFCGVVTHDSGDPADTARGTRCAGGDRTYRPGTWHRPEHAQD